jgi:hypothetical protein
MWRRHEGLGGAVNLAALHPCIIDARRHFLSVTNHRVQSSTRPSTTRQSLASIHSDHKTTLNLPINGISEQVNHNSVRKIHRARALYLRLSDTIRILDRTFG